MKFYIVFFLSFSVHLGLAQVDKLAGFQSQDDNNFYFVDYNISNCTPDTIGNGTNPFLIGDITMGVSSSCEEMFYPGFNGNNFGLLKANKSSGISNFLSIISPIQEAYPLEIEYDENTNFVYCLSKGRLNNECYYSKIDIVSGLESVLKILDDDFCSHTSVDNRVTMDYLNQKIYQIKSDYILTSFDIQTQILDTILFPDFNFFIINNLNFDNGELVGIGYHNVNGYGILKFNTSTYSLNWTMPINDPEKIQFAAYNKNNNTMSISTYLTSWYEGNRITNYNINDLTFSECVYGYLNYPMVYTDCSTSTLIEIDYKVDFNIFPNPAHDFLIIESQFLKEIISVELMDLTGKIKIKSDDLVINIESIDPGQYMGRIKLVDCVYFFKFIKE